MNFEKIYKMEIVMGEKADLLYKDLCYDVIGSAYEAFKKVGVGFDELRYHKVFDRCLIKKGLNARYKVPVQLFYRGECVANFEIDEIIEDKIIVELKCIQTDFIPENYAQVLTYLKATKLRLGLLINFVLHQAYSKRVLFDEQRTEDSEKWDEDYFNNATAKDIVQSVVSSIRCVDRELGAAYHNKIYQAALAVEFRQKSIAYNDKVSIEKTYDNLRFKPFDIDYWLVEDLVLFGILAGKDKPRAYDLFRMRPYLRSLKLNHGLIVYWSNKNVQLYGIYEA